MNWFRRRAERKAQRERAAEIRWKAYCHEWKQELEVREKVRQQQDRQARIDASARRIAEQLYSTYRLASIITNAPDPAERFDCIDGLVDEALDAATKIEGGLEVKP